MLIPTQASWSLQWVSVACWASWPAEGSFDGLPRCWACVRGSRSKRSFCAGRRAPAFCVLLPMSCPRCPCVTVSLSPSQFLRQSGEVGPGISPIARGPWSLPASLYPFGSSFCMNCEAGSSFFPLHVDIHMRQLWAVLAACWPPVTISCKFVVASNFHPTVHVCVSYARNTTPSLTAAW